MRNVLSHSGGCADPVSIAAPERTCHPRRPACQNRYVPQRQPADVPRSDLDVRGPASGDPGPRFHVGVEGGAGAAVLAGFLGTNSIPFPADSIALPEWVCNDPRAGGPALHQKIGTSRCFATCNRYPPAEDASSVPGTPHRGGLSARRRTLQCGWCSRSRLCVSCAEGQAGRSPGRGCARTVPGPPARGRRHGC